MNCPYCKRHIYGMTGLQELNKFEKHLARCRKNPNNRVIKVGGEVKGGKTIVLPKRHQDLRDALDIRAESGQ